MPVMGRPSNRRVGATALVEVLCGTKSHGFEVVEAYHHFFKEVGVLLV